MDSLYKTFGFHPPAFNSLLAKTGAFVAGGAATYMLSGKNPEDFDGDLDIWYPHAPQRDAFETDEYGQKDIVKVNAYLYARQLLESYLTEHGYQERGFDREMTTEYTNKENPLSQQILCIRYFEFMNKRVQIIFAFHDAKEILDSFDYSFCAVGCGADKTFFGKELALSKEGKGYAMNPARTPGRDALRREKYEKRGFTLIRTPDCHKA